MYGWFTFHNPANQFQYFAYKHACSQEIKLISNCNYSAHPVSLSSAANDNDSSTNILRAVYFCCSLLSSDKSIWDSDESMRSSIGSAFSDVAVESKELLNCQAFQYIH